MVPKANIKLAITGALLVILVGSVHGCGSDPTGAPAADDPPNCVWIDGRLICN